MYVHDWIWINGISPRGLVTGAQCIDDSYIQIQNTWSMTIAFLIKLDLLNKLDLINMLLI